MNMNTKLKLTSGLDYGEDANGKRVCRGAQMGRPNIIPHGLTEKGTQSVKLHLERLQWVDGDYDQGGAYWGCPGRGMYVYCAWGKWGINMAFVQVFVRAISRKDAKSLVRDDLPFAKFFH